MVRHTIKTLLVTAAILLPRAALADNQGAEPAALPCNSLCKTWLALGEARPTAEAPATTTLDLHPAAALEDPSPAKIAPTPPGTVTAVTKPVRRAAIVTVLPPARPSRAQDRPRLIAAAAPVPSVRPVPVPGNAAPGMALVASVAVAVPPPTDPAFDPAFASKPAMQAAPVAPEPQEPSAPPVRQADAQPTLPVEAPPTAVPPEAPTQAPRLGAGAASPARDAAIDFPPPFDVIAAVLLQTSHVGGRADDRLAALRQAEGATVAR